MMEALSSRGIQIIAVERSEMRSMAFYFSGYSSLPCPIKPHHGNYILSWSILEMNKNLRRRMVFKYVVLILLNLF